MPTNTNNCPKVCVEGLKKIEQVANECPSLAARCDLGDFADAVAAVGLAASGEEAAAAVEKLENKTAELANNAAREARAIAVLKGVCRDTRLAVATNYMVGKSKAELLTSAKARCIETTGKTKRELALNMFSAQTKGRDPAADEAERWLREKTADYKSQYTRQQLEKLVHKAGIDGSFDTKANLGRALAWRTAHL